MVTERNAGSKSDGFRSGFETYLVDLATTIVINRITETKDSMNRVTSTSTTSTTVNADIQWATKQDIEHLNMGNMKIGDGIMFVEYDADVELEDELTYNSVPWRVKGQIEGEQVTGDVIYKAFLIQRNQQS